MLIPLCLLFALNDCSKKTPTEPSPPPPPPFETSHFEGSVSLPPDARIRVNQLQILSPIEKSSVDPSGNFTLNGIDTEKPQIIIALSSSGNPLLLAFVLPNERENIEISATSTAKALVLSNPIFLFTSASQREQILQGLNQRADFQDLVEDISRLLISDPERTLDYTAHPRIYEQAASIAIGLLKEHGSWGFSKPPLQENPWVEDAPEDTVVFFNPKSVHFSVGIYPSGWENPKDTFLLDAKSSLVSYQFGWPPVYWTPPTRTPYKLGDGTFTARLTKGFDFSDISNFTWDDLNGKASQANIAKGVLLMVDLLIGFAPTVPITQLRLTGNETMYMLTQMAIDMEQGDAFGLIGHFAQLILTNVDQICYWLWQEATTDATRQLASKLFKILGNVATAVKVVTVGEAAANRVIPFFYDLIFGDRWITLTLVQSNGNLITNAANQAPDKPLISASTHSGTVGTLYSFRAMANDPEGNAIAYRFHWGEGTTSGWTEWVPSGTELSRSHSYNSPGIYQVVAEAKDDQGAVSPLSDPVSIHINPAGTFFYYNFDGDLVGGFPSDPPWTSEQRSPSYLRIVNDVFFGPEGKSCGFFDYDPSIDTTGGEFAQIYAYIENKQKGTIEFAWQVKTKEDNFGLRAWEDWDWSVMGYYVLFHAAHICYYYQGEFHQLMSIEPNRWYQMKLSYDLGRQRYDITIDGTTVATDVPFVGNPRSLSILQIVAFSDATCRAGYVDEIKLSSSFLFKLAKGMPIPKECLRKQPM